MKTASALALLTTGALPLLGCGGQDLAACDPLAPHELPTKLATVVAAGKHTDGTIYVIDQPAGGDNRVFVSEGGTLVRKRVAGSGATPGSLVVTVSETDPPLVLKAELAAGKATRMGVVRGTITGKDFEIGQQGDVLTLVGADVVGALAVRNLPGTVTVEYVADVEDGRRIVVTRPTDDWSYQDFRLFLGTPPSLGERKVLNVVRGSYTDITFDLGGMDAQAHFPSPLGGGDPFLKVGTEMQRLVVSGSPTAAGLSFLCR